METIKLFLQNLNPIYYLIVGLVIIGILIFTKNYKAVKEIAEQGIRYSAKYFNSDEGQKKLDNAVMYLQSKSKDMPWLARILVEKIGSKFVLVGIIEWFYKRIKEKLKLELADNEIDIKGNETKKKQ